jgi:hypothetical protein
MSDPKLHHYVPQFYLRRFCDASNRLWAWDRDRDRVFLTSPGSVAAERSFYYLDLLAEYGHDPLTMERQFASLEHEVACITSQWIEWIRDGSLGMRIPLVRMPWDAAPALGERLGVTVRAARRDLVTARDRVPGRLSPLDRAAVGPGAMPL